MTCSIDYETRSNCDLIKEGAYRYATDPSTGVYMMSYQLPSDVTRVWVYGQAFPQPLIDFIEDDGIFTAWNAQFERLIWWYVLSNDPQYAHVPEPELWQFQCTAARARAHGLPGHLKDCARALGRRQQKDTEGDRLIRQYSAQNVPWSEIPQPDQALFKKYCAQDTKVEQDIASTLRELTDEEWEEYYINEEINDRGVPVDMAFVRQASQCADYVRDNADQKVAELTLGSVTTTRKRKSRDEWVLPRLTPAQLKVLANGEKVSFEESRREELLTDPDLDDEIRRYLELVEEGGGAAVRKYEAIKNREIDGKINGVLLFNGAGQTGRFSSRGLQMHNMKRAKVPDAQKLITQIMKQGVTSQDDPAKLLSSLVRSTIYDPEGLSWFDWSSIEGRMAPWLAGDRLGEAKLELYRQGVDPYIYNAAKTFRVPYESIGEESDERQAGKVQELALQFLGGVGALRSMAIKFGMKVSEEEAQRLVDGWRDANPWARKFGDALNAAAIKAVQHPGQTYPAGRVSFIKLGNWLWCELPCGRLLAYAHPRVEQVKTPWGALRAAVTCVWGAAKPKVGEPWPRRAMHGGIWLENVTQGTAASLLRLAIVRARTAGVDIILHVHDEILAGGSCVEVLRKFMLSLPVWAEGLPLDGAGGSGERYGK